MVISFSDPQARAQLLGEAGIAHTFRIKRRHKPRGRDWVNEERLGKKIADVWIDEEGNKSITQLLPHVATSGFDSLPQWKQAIQRMNKKKITKDTRGWLYFVTLEPEKLHEVRYMYKIGIRGANGVQPILAITALDLLKRYNRLDVTPTLMFVRDMACSTGIAPWSYYTRLRVSRIKGINNRQGH